LTRHRVSIFHAGQGTIGAARLLDRRSQNTPVTAFGLLRHFLLNHRMAKLKSAAKRELINTGTTSDSWAEERRVSSRRQMT
jgi:hypothetical protein